MRMSALGSSTLPNITTPAALSEADLYSLRPDGFDRVHLSSVAPSPLNPAMQHDAERGLWYSAATVNGQPVVRCTDDNGDLQFQRDLPNHAVGLLLDARTDLLYVSGAEDIEAIHAATGQTAAARHFDSFDYARRLTMLDDGTLVLTDDGRLETLDAHLETTGEQPIGIRPEHVRELPDGRLLMIERSKVGVVDLQGHSAFDSPRTYERSTVIDPSGRIWTLESACVARFDPATGTVERIAVADDASAFCPLPDGRFLVYSFDGERPALTIHGEDGEPRRTMTFDGVATLDSIHLSADGQTAWLKGSRSTGASTTALFRVDLDDAPAPIPSTGQRLVQKGSGLLARVPGVARVAGSERLARLADPTPRVSPLHTSESAAFIPVPLEDGRILLSRRHDSTVIDGDGQVLERLPKAEDLDALVDNGPATDGLTMKLRPEGPPDLAARFTDPRLARRESVPPSTVPPVVPEAVSEDGALQALALPSVDALAGLLHARDAVIEDERIALPGDAGTLIATSQALTVDDATFPLAAGERLSSVLPVSSGDGVLVAAGTDAGGLYIFDAAAVPPRTQDAVRFDMGSPVRGVSVVEGRLLAAAANGNLLVVHPSEIPLSGPGLPGAASPRDDQRIEVEHDRVIIGGVALERRQIA